MNKGTVILSGGLLVKIHNYLKNLQLTNSQNHSLELLFNISGTFTTGNNGFKADVMPTDLTNMLCDGTTESDELIKYYQSVLFDALNQNTNCDFFEWFKVLQEGIALYHNQSYIDELNNFFVAKKGKMEKIQQHKTTVVLPQFNYPTILMI